ncbi:hypothetical protein DFJ74DRAFT_673002 [Hyaloraphidium curvatum]|nr:hypothetical protein DFJ74DRAFT_673002 [Hyaloraphidium curvatum]
MAAFRVCLLAAAAVFALAPPTSALPACANLARLRAAAQTEVWSLPILNIAGIAYTDESTSVIGNASADLNTTVSTLLPPLPCPYVGATAKVPGKWVVEWGPAISPGNANFIYAASYRLANTSAAFSANSSAFPPVFLAFGVRGTDSKSNGTALLLQLLEDFQPFTTVNWASNIASRAPLGIRCPLPIGGGNGTRPNQSQPSTSPVVAWGSCIGLKTLMTITARSPTLGGGRVNALAFLNAFLARWGTGVPVTVTGHSLGGTQTTTVAMYLQARVPAARVGAFPIAPATAGNKAFADLFTATMGNRSRLYMNTLDIVPHGYQFVLPTLGLWFLYGGPATPAALVPVTLLAADLVSGIGYTHPMPHSWMRGRYAPNSNATYPSDSAWGSQLEWQHFPPTYYAMMCYYFRKTGGVSRRTMADYPLGVWRVSVQLRKRRLTLLFLQSKGQEWATRATPTARRRWASLTRSDPCRASSRGPGEGEASARGPQDKAFYSYVSTL